MQLLPSCPLAQNMPCLCYEPTSAVGIHPSLFCYPEPFHVQTTNLWTLAFHLTSFPPLDMGGNIVSWLSLLTHSRPSHSINAYSAPLSHRQSECSPRCILSPRIIDECVDFANTLCRCVPLCRSSLLRGTTPIHVGLPRANFFPFYPLWWYQ